MHAAGEWIECGDAMPRFIENEYRFESARVLARFATGYIAVCTLADYGDWVDCRQVSDSPKWYVCGPDGYSAGLDEVTHWAEINPPA